MQESDYQIDIRKKTLKGLAWSLVERSISRGMQFIIGIIMARLLVPEMFGLVAMLMIFIELGEIFVDSGFGTALLQKSDISESDVCSVFYFNIIVASIAATLLFLAAPMIASFYKQSVLTSLARALSLTFILNAFGAIQINLFMRRVDFKSQAIISAITTAISGSIGIIMAVMGYGVWSIVIQQISAAAVKNLFYWYQSTWRPSLLFSINSLRQMLKFCFSILGIGILNRSSDSIYYMVIGKLFSATELGIFSRATQLQGFPSSLLAIVVGRVTFPVLAKMQNDQMLFKSSLRMILVIISFLIFPVMIGLAAVAKPLILFLLTAKWGATVPYMQILVIVGITYPLEWILQQAMQALGKPNLSLRVEFFKKVFLFINIAVMWHFGMIGIAIGMILPSMLSLFLNMRYVAMLTKYSLKEQVLDMLPYLLISILMGFLLFASNYLLNNYGLVLQLFIQFLVGSIFYVGLSWLFRTTAIREIQKNWKYCLGA